MSTGADARWRFTLDVEVDADDLVEALVALHLRLGLSSDDWTLWYDAVVPPLGDGAYPTGTVEDAHAEAMPELLSMLPAHCTRRPCCRNLVQVQGRPLCQLTAEQLAELGGQAKAALMEMQNANPIIKRALGGLLERTLGGKG